jgi:hypothetical protein
MTTRPHSTTETRIRENGHFARLLRQGLESRHGNGALREMLARMTDAELIEAYLRNEEQRRNDVARRRAEKAASE